MSKTKAPARRPRAPIGTGALVLLLAIGLAGVGAVILTADQPTQAWRKFVGIVSASLCYLALSHLLRVARPRHDYVPRRALDDESTQ